MLNSDLEREYLIEYMFILEKEKEEEIKFYTEHKKLPAKIIIKIEKDEHNLKPSRATV